MHALSPARRQPLPPSALVMSWRELGGDLELLQPSAAKTQPAEIAPTSPRILKDKPVGDAAKRIFDIGTAILLLIVFGPLLLLIALIVRWESPGPALFRQHRGGFNGRTFRIYKFRTMRCMEDGATVCRSVQGDARVTRIGEFLRRSSLDEFPQLLNVLRGEMSLIGPRPHAVAHDDQLAAVDPRYFERQAARPGITGLAQVCGSRGPLLTDDEVRRRTAYDIAYARRWSWPLDVKIMGLTTALILRGKL